ncbi:MAG: O-methyltransferase [Streptosporangiaceae bacterium]
MSSIVMDGVIAFAHPRELPRTRDQLRQAFGLAPVSNDGRDPCPIREETARQERECAEHDRYFGVSRSSHLSALKNSITEVALQVGKHLADDGTPLFSCGGEEVLLGAEQHLRALAEGRTPRLEPPDVPVPAQFPGVCRNTDDHWRIGHRLFFVLIQSMAVTLQCFEDDWTHGRTSDAVRDLAATAALARSSSMAMSYAAAFGIQEYESQVRPSMLPPTVNEGFSGLQTRDHRHLIAVMRQVAPALADARRQADLNAGLGDVRAALQQMYTAHGYVCTHFGGDSMPSLRMEAQQRENARPGMDIVREMAAARLASLPEPKEEDHMSQPTISVAIESQDPIDVKALGDKSAFLREDIHRYVAENATPHDALLASLLAETHQAVGERSLMVVPPEQGQLLTMLTQMLGARLAVEVGTFTGYSAICIARGLAPGGKLITCDINPELAAIASRYFAAAGLDDQIELRLGDAAETLRNVPGQIDFAFIDADKPGYVDYYELLVPRMRPGGIICADNVLWFGQVTELYVDDEHVAGIRDFNDHVRNDPRVDRVMVPIGDGITLLRKR